MRLLVWPLDWVMCSLRHKYLISSKDFRSCCGLCSSGRIALSCKTCQWKGHPVMQASKGMSTRSNKSDQFWLCQRCFAAWLCPQAGAWPSSSYSRGTGSLIKWSRRGQQLVRHFQTFSTSYGQWMLTIITYNKVEKNAVSNHCLHMRHKTLLFIIGSLIGSIGSPLHILNL